MAEAEIKNDIIVTLSHGPVRLFRMQVGEFQLKDGRWIASGRKGMADLLGWTTITITPDMVGKKIAVYTSIEVKSRTGRWREGQPEWMQCVADAGGIAGMARSVSDAIKIIFEWKP